MLKRRVDKAVILAAGDGDRLGSLTLTCPKVLLPVNDKAPLIRYPIEALVAAGISEIAIVVGYLGDKVVEALGNGSNFGARLQYISNSDYLGGNAISAYKARDWAQGEPIVLCMGDHLIEKKLVTHLLDRETFNETLCIDYTPARHHQLDEATKVTVDNAGYIKNIGKELAYWDALDTGVFLLTENFFQALDELVHRLGTDIEITDVVRFLISQGHRFDTHNASGCFWMDVDTEEDLTMARM
jgi:glucose-1-phosphate thymidylyltransferase